MAQRGIECGSSARSRASGRAGRRAGWSRSKAVQRGSCARALACKRRGVHCGRGTAAASMQRDAAQGARACRPVGGGGAGTGLLGEARCGACRSASAAARAVAGAQRRWPAVSAATYSARTARRPAQPMRRWWPCGHCSSCAASVSSSSPSHYSPPFLLSVTWNTCRC